MTYAIQFDFPERTMWAGDYGGAYGWAPSLATALMFTDPDEARRVLQFGYGSSQDWGRVVVVSAKVASR